MTVRENVHQLVDTLPEDRLDDALEYFVRGVPPDTRSVNYEVSLSSRAAKDLDRVSRDTRERLAHLANAPHDPRLSSPLTGKGSLRKSRLAG